MKEIYKTTNAEAARGFAIAHKCARIVVCAEGKKWYVVYDPACHVRPTITFGRVDAKAAEILYSRATELPGEGK